MTTPRIQPLYTRELRIAALREQLAMAVKYGHLSLVSAIKRDIEETSKHD